MNPLRSICLIIGALAAVHTVASTPQPVGRSSRPRLGPAFDKRQSDIDVPPQCTSTCDPVISILEGQSCAPSLCCTTLFQHDYFLCLNCTGTAENATTADFAMAQSLVDALTVVCSKAGFPLPELTFPGQNPNRTLSTLSGSQTSAKQSQITVSVPPSTLPPTSTHSQITITNLPSTTPTNPSATFSFTTLGPTTSTGAAVHHTVTFGMGLLSLVVGWMML
ncbi:hypothetical protein B0H17DRAFT_1089568 [Mycena rosella]|uniref:Extracellular membrane protein CFEM domain-containing protein n=1 Tax=Mycena rosella TaxID=1033263 RepID=A0AAD7G4G3_MYCRO|nr:hypothetical protein B0H17DRAFT_1089568 [Mycena rosella]